MELCAAWTGRGGGPFQNGIAHGIAGIHGKPFIQASLGVAPAHNGAGL